MNKIYGKMAVIATQLILALSMVVMSSYAWMTLSTNPSVEGIQIAIGGGNTILVAADLTKEVDGQVYHYPANFSDTLYFQQYESYDYLSEVCGLTPVSTADGIHWFLPEYYDSDDPEVKLGQAQIGQIKPVSEFTLDDTLQHANLSLDEKSLAKKGSYTYLDFWVVSPGSEYTLRVSTGEDSGGSFAIGLDGTDSAATCVRAGLLVNPDGVLDDSMIYYQESPGFNEQYSRLCGSYKEPDGTNVYSSGYRFYIYEPNGDLHPALVVEQGEGLTEPDERYYVTEPLGLVESTTAGAVIAPVDIRDRLTVQKTSTWLEEDEELIQYYCENYEGQVGPYVKKGLFFKNTGNLYNSAGTVTPNVVEADYLGEGFTAGATDDTYIIQLEKNVPQRIRLFVWLEGQDVDCVNTASASSFSLKLELAGSNADINE